MTETIKQATASENAKGFKRTPPTIKRIAAGYYEARFPVTLIAHGEQTVVTAHAEIIKREDGSGWSFTLKASRSGFSTYLSAHEDVYSAKSHIVEFFRSDRSRYWEYVTDHGLNSWCMSSSRSPRLNGGE
jgi:hypothetical protein